MARSVPAMRTLPSAISRSATAASSLSEASSFSEAAKVSGGGETHPPPKGNRPRPAGPVAGRNPIGVALHDLDALDRHVEILGDDLRVGGLVALPGGLGADEHGEIAIPLEPDRTFLALAPGGAFDVARKAESANLPPRPGILRPTLESGLIRLLQAGAHSALEIADIVIAVGVRVIRHLVGLDEIARAQLFRR